MAKKDIIPRYKSKFVTPKMKSDFLKTHGGKLPSLSHLRSSRKMKGSGIFLD